MFILGSTTLGLMVLDVARDMGLTVDGFIDDFTKETSVAGVPVRGTVDWLLDPARAAPPVDAFVAVGDNEKRMALVERLRANGVRLPTIVHPRAYVAPSARLGDANLVMPFAYVGTDVRAGDANVLLTGACIHHHSEVGDAGFFAPGVVIGGRAVIGRFCRFGMNAAVMHDMHVPDGFTCAACAVVEPS